MTPRKARATRIKHGLDFLAAQDLWTGVRVEFLAKTAGAERRYAVLGKIRDAHHTVIITYRGSDVRIISARPSSTNEKALYEQKTKIK